MAYGAYAYNSLSNYVIFKMEKYIVLSTLIDELVQCSCHKRHKYEIITHCLLTVLPKVICQLEKQLYEKNKATSKSTFFVEFYVSLGFYDES